MNSCAEIAYSGYGCKITTRDVGVGKESNISVTRSICVKICGGNSATKVLDLNMW
jgi:hypothetical protein